MPRLSAADRNRLIHIVTDQPLFQSYRGRRQLLELSGLEGVAPQIDLEGPSLIVAAELVQVLEAYGRVTPQHAALGLFLNTVKEIFGGSDPGREAIDDILQRYKLMTPITTTGFTVPWAGSASPDATAEKIIGENTLRHISFLQRGIEAAKSVALVHTGQWVGTAFLVAPDLILTNNHVLPSRDVAEASIIRFNYQLELDGTPAQVHDVAVRPAGLFITDKNLDFTLTELSDPVGEKWARIGNTGAAVGQRVNIVQHPAGMPKQVSIHNNMVQYVDEKVVQYLTTTLGGSSGSPVFDDEWAVVAVHHAGGLLEEPRTGRTYFRNEGIAIAAILDALPPHARERIHSP
ncbi:trypsin-like peptidase domain-containing protein [Streptomyces mirabilis]